MFTVKQLKSYFFTPNSRVCDMEKEDGRISNYKYDC